MKNALTYLAGFIAIMASSFSFGAEHFYRSAPEETPHVRVLGTDTHGVFSVYDLSGYGLNDIEYFSAEWKFRTEDLVYYLNVIGADEVAIYGLRCESLCANKDHQIVGMSEAFFVKSVAQLREQQRFIQEGAEQLRGAFQ